MEEMSAPSGSEIKCNICDETFSKLYNLRRHLVRSHGLKRDDMDYSENIAFYSKNIASDSKNIAFDSENIASDSKNIASTDNPTHTDTDFEYKCSKCSETFKRQWNLKRHIEKCNVKNKYECEHCHKIFAQISSKYRHYKTCKEKLEADAKTVIIKNHCQEANVINNNNTHIENQNNHTHNNTIVLVYKPENMEFIKDHIGESALEYIKKIYPKIDRRMMLDYSKRIMDLPENRCIKKDNLNVGYSDVYVGNNQWEKTTDKVIYPELACSLANDMSSYINERRSKFKKEVFDKIIGFVDYMSDEGYMNTEDKEKEKKVLREFKLFVKELRMVVFNRSK